ncbi:metallophosphoesterase family protein [Anianabacter salinae]|uniref:metallophosphoesterase family protein n=1 Tax=Anianabacter salinae TaxID=2851023 RepID=UPI00225DF3ED|nr:metallophosphoesterase family protein [Anianabacter salinae]MBV0913453.1 serine/threonine protein phosphatase [Anianabacter salinae]
MFRFLKRAGTASDPREVWPVPQPDGPLYAVGDIHGQADLLERMIVMLDEDMRARGLGAAQVVFLGDYIDRGDRSGDVLFRLMDLADQFPDNVVCLRGNHEQMMLDFLNDPEGKGPRWLRNGGLQTMASLDVPDVSERMGPNSLREAAATLSRRLTPAGVAWLNGLRFSYLSGNVACIHAALDPDKGLKAQDDDTLIWGHPQFGKKDRDDGLWAVHGHTVVDDPVALRGRVAVDTGAYFSGRLTAAALFPGQPARFITASL